MKDFVRVGEGFERDVRKRVDGVWEGQIGRIPDEAAKVLDEMVEKRKDGLQDVEEGIRALDELVRSTKRG